MKTFTCTICRKVAKNILHSSRPRVTCGSTECLKIRQSILAIQSRRRKELADLKICGLRSNRYTDNLSAYADKLIDYPYSPTGRAYIGFAKTPLMPNANGIGYMGVKIQSENRELIQCFECGEWFKQLSGHLKFCADLTAAEYKDAFGYNQGTGLIADVSSNLVAEVAVARGNLKHLKGIPGGHKQRPRKGSMENKNLHGTCPEQLKTRLVNYVNRFKMLPGTDSQREAFPYHAAAKLYGSFNGFLKAHGFPTKRKHGLTTDYTFPDGLVYSKLAKQDYDQLFALLLAKCPLLTSNL